MFKFYKEIEEELKNSNLTPEEKTTYIKAAGELYHQQVEKEYKKNIRDYRLGAALEIGSAAIPGVAGTKMASKIAPKVIQKTIGRKLVNDTLSGAINSGLSGGVYGFGEGLAENKNPFTNSAQKATEGLITGGITSHLVGNINKTALGNKLQSYGNIDDLSENARKNYNKDVRKYYQDYIQSTSMNKNGNIDFTRTGIQENLRWNPHQGQNMPYLVNDIRNAKRLPNEPNLKANQKPDVNHYEVYRGKLGDHYVENYKKGQRRYYITKDTPDNVIPTASRGAIESANNIIPNSISDFNPPKWVNSQTATLGQAINNNIQNNIPNFDSNTVVTTRGKSQQIPKYDKIFTPKDIEKMKPEEFVKNEKVINEQVKQGLIAPVTYRKQNYAGYKNPVSGDNRIFTQEEIGNLTKEEFNKHEKEIQGQWGSIGIPSESEMSSSGAIYVEPYTRSNGVQVKGHYRSR